MARPSDGVQNMLAEIQPRRALDDLILPESVITAALELIEEQHRADLLRSHGIEPRHRLLLVGPPGNGKTSLAEAIAEALLVPMYVVRYESVIGSYLGETASRLRQIFDTIRSRRCVLFLDEFDALAKERGDVHETGEIKRVVSSLLLQLDALPSYVTVITASNHPELLDRAVWRRFQLKLLLPPPTNQQVAQWLKSLEVMIGEPLGLSTAAILNKLGRPNFSDLEEFGLDVRRQIVLRQPSERVEQIVRSRLDQWAVRVDLATSP